MDDAHERWIAKVLEGGELIPAPGIGASSSLLEDHAEPRVAELIARVRRDPSEAGVERALAWFYGAGLPDKTAPEPSHEVLDYGQAVIAALEACIAQDGLEVFKARFLEAYHGSSE